MKIKIFKIQHESEIYGRTLKVNYAKPMQIKQGQNKPSKYKYILKKNKNKNKTKKDTIVQQSFVFIVETFNRHYYST
jgi:hypothetical protein